jgi:hypothetical protein
MRILATEAVRTAVLVLREQSVGFPMWARLTAIIQLRRPPKILICVRVDTLMPVMLYSIWTPERLEAVHVEVVGAPSANFFVGIKQLGADLLSTVGKSTIATSLTR